MFITAAWEPECELCLEVHTNQPEVQLYTRNFLSEVATLKGNLPCYKYAGFCLETHIITVTLKVIYYVT